MNKTILITGASRGFGHIWAKAFLQQGYNVVAAARNLSSLDDLKAEFGSNILPLQLDVRNREQCFAVVNEAKQHFGQLDVVINNAGYGLFGAVEEVEQEAVSDLFETNVFGSLWVSQAAIPIMWEQGKGHIIQVSSVLGVVSLPGLGLYNASKFASEAITEALAGEVKSFGIKATIIEPNAYGTDFGKDSAKRSSQIDLYDDVKAAVLSTFTEDAIGDPQATVSAILEIVETENPPLRVFFGKMGYPIVAQVYQQRLQDWEAWQDFSIAAHR